MIDIDTITAGHVLTTVTKALDYLGVGSTPAGYDGTLGSLIVGCVPDTLTREQSADLIDTIIWLINNGTGKFTTDTVLQTLWDFENSFCRIEAELTDELTTEYGWDEDADDHDDWDAPDVIVLGI